MWSGGAMVGREVELARVDELVGAVPQGKGGVLLVLGEAGIGKTRLLGAAIERARERGVSVLTGSAVAGGGAYRPLSEALAGLLRDARLTGDELRPYRAALGRLLPEWAGETTPSSVDPVVVLGEGLVRLLRTLNGDSGCLLVLEDVHWADGDTLAVLEYLSRVLSTSPLLVAASLREEECPPCVMNRLLPRPEVLSIRLGRLTREDVRALADRCAPSLPERLRELAVAKSDGLPFLVKELVAEGLEGEVPPTFAVLVEQRLAALGPDRRRVLEAAAVLGEPDWTLLGEAAGVPEEGVLGALRAAQPRLVVPEGDALGWRHALTREAVLAGVPPADRAVLARRLGEALLGRDDTRAADLLAAAGERERAAGIYLRLARRDLDRGALRDARALLDRAGGGTAVVIERIRLLTLLGEAEAAVETGAGALGDAVGDDHARLCLRLADAAILLGRWDDAERYADRAGRPADPQVLVIGANAAFGAGDLRRAARLAMAAVEGAERDGDGSAHCQALVVLGQCALRHDFAAARVHYAAAARRAAEHGLLPLRVRALSGLAFIECDDDDPGSPALTEARELALELGQLAEVVAVDLFRAEQRVIVTGPRAVLPLARETADLAARLGLTGAQAVAELFVAYGLAHSGDHTAMETVLDAARSRPHVPLEITALAPAVRGLCRIMARDLAGADRLLTTAVTALRGQHQTVPVAEWGLWALLRTVLGEDGGTALATLRYSSAALRRVNRGALHYADAVAAGRAGRPEEAVRQFAAGDQALVHRGWWRRLCRLLALESAVADGWGDPVRELRADLTAFEDAADEALARTARDLLRRAGAPTRRSRGQTRVPPGLRAAGVTGREMDVLLLVAEGLTNRQIAERLFLSPRTIDTHVANLLAKTGASRRAELGTCLTADRTGH
ncbi:ATP-binding protein [Actinomadura rubrisoli]|uniref:LuxR family transcriptional regulator n=1 Tax=Actinomadura rubrisoli TaxID=2530368 RepID=A0A4R5B3A6_9ACTN|nr:LuxR family transcriptional regulator [Actinomadura rubrisoli]TDD79000.1 LuxR family transcriptional regulator [Actinomadura rubrisoli]